MKILLWHGYLLAVPAPMSTRARSRVPGRISATRSSSSARTRIRSATTSAGAAVVRPDDRPRSCRSSWSTATRISRRGASRTSTGRAPTASSRRTRLAIREHLPADLVFTNHLLLGGPVGAAVGVPYVVKAHGSELEFSMRGNEELCAWARGRSSRRGDPRRHRAHPPRDRGGARTGRPRCDRCTSSRRASTSRSSARRPKAEALAGLLAECRARPPEPAGGPRPAPAGRGERRAARRVPRRRRADGRLRRADQPREGRARARRGARAAAACARDGGLGRHPRGARGETSTLAASSSRAPSSTAISSTCSRSRTSR